MTREHWRRIVIALVVFWAALFLAGAAGELFDIDWLRSLTDFKRFFLS